MVIRDETDARVRRLLAELVPGAGEAVAGAETVRQYLWAGLLDELQVHVAPILLGGAPGCSTRSARRLLHGVSLPGRGA